MAGAGRALESAIFRARVACICKGTCYGNSTCYGSCYGSCYAT